MPVQAGPFHRRRPPGSARKPSEQESRTMPGGSGEPSHRTGRSPDEPRPQDRPERKRPTLVTPPAGHRHLKGRY
jgi:hypothetical protein